MKKLALACALAFGALTLAGQPARADNRDFELTNGTGYPIKHVYIDENSSDSWTDDILGRDILNDGESVQVQFGKGDKGCMWDMKVVYDDGDTAVWHGFNLCTINSIKLKWNKSTGVTTAVTN